MFFFFFSSRRRHTRWPRDWSSECALPILWACSPFRLPAKSFRLNRLLASSTATKPQASSISKGNSTRSEERRVGKGCRSRGSRDRGNRERKSEDEGRCVDRGEK